MMKLRFFTVTVFCCMAIVVNGEVKKKDSNISNDVLRVKTVSKGVYAPKYRHLEPGEQQNAISIADPQEREEREDSNPSNQVV